MAMSTLDTVSFPMLNAVQTPPPSLSGRIKEIDVLMGGLGGTSYMIYKVDPLTKNSLQLPVGSQVAFVIIWENRNTTGNIKGHVDFKLTRPDGTVVTLALAQPNFQDYVLGPGYYWAPYTELATIAATGIYSGVATLSGEAA